MLRHVLSCYLQSQRTKKMPLDFKGLLPLIFVELGGKPQGPKKKSIVGNILTSGVTSIVNQGASAPGVEEQIEP